MATFDSEFGIEERLELIHVAGGQRSDLEAVLGGPPWRVLEPSVLATGFAIRFPRWFGRRRDRHTDMAHRTNRVHCVRLLFRIMNM